ncbi:MAG: hypothetical protein AB7P52_17860 [Alphaproteobacteria bacterium]
MSQHDFIIDSQAMPAARADINAALQALASTNKGSTAPATPYAGELWIDDSASPWTLKLYDGADWITVGTVNTTSNTFTPAGGGGVVAGTTLVLNPFTQNQTVTQAHGLGGEPDMGFEVILECITTDLGWSVGDRVRISEVGLDGNADAGFTVYADATNVYLITHQGFRPHINRKDNRLSADITAANWKIEVTPFLGS